MDITPSPTRPDPEIEACIKQEEEQIESLEKKLRSISVDLEKNGPERRKKHDAYRQHQAAAHRAKAAHAKSIASGRALTAQKSACEDLLTCRKATLAALRQPSMMALDAEMVDVDCDDGLEEDDLEPLRRLGPPAHDETPSPIRAHAEGDLSVFSDSETTENSVNFEVAAGPISKPSNLRRADDEEDSHILERPKFVPFQHRKETDPMPFLAQNVTCVQSVALEHPGRNQLDTPDPSNAQQSSDVRQSPSAQTTTSAAQVAPVQQCSHVENAPDTRQDNSAHLSPQLSTGGEEGVDLEKPFFPQKSSDPRQPILSQQPSNAQASRAPKPADVDNGAKESNAWVSHGGKEFKSNPRKKGTNTTSRLHRPTEPINYDPRKIEQLKTPFEMVFKLSEDKATFSDPSLMEGVPTTRIEEKGGYWEDSWDTLDYIRSLATNASSGRGSREQTSTTPDQSEQELTKEMPSDDKVNLTPYMAQAVIAWLGNDGQMHPNQLVAKGLLTKDGLCNADAVFRLASMMRRLSILAKEKLITMSPENFIR